MKKQMRFESHYLYRWKYAVLAVFLCITITLAYFATKVEKSYEYFSTLPKTNATLQEFLSFQKTFRQEGASMVIGIESAHLFDKNHLQAYRKLHHQLETIQGVQSVLSVVSAVSLEKDERAQRFHAKPLFDTFFIRQAQLDSQVNLFRQLGFYKDVLYHNDAYLMVLNIDPSLAMTQEREMIISSIENVIQDYESTQHIAVHVSGLPLIRTKVATLISQELRSLLLLSALFLLLSIFFIYRSWIDVCIATIIVGIGILWSFGTIALLGYKLTILTAIVPSIIVIIGIPNSIYFLNKYHAQLQQGLSKSEAIRKMLDSMGTITLFCNLTMAIGFFVFTFTKSQLLHEFGVVAGVNVLLKFLLSYAVIPLLLYVLPTHQKKIKQQQANQKMTMFIYRFNASIYLKRNAIYGLLFTFLLFSMQGIMRLKTSSFIIDDVPKTDKVVSDLKFFEQNFKGILPLEVIIKSKRKNAFVNNLKNLEQIDLLSQQMATHPALTRSLSILEGIKFARQSYYYQDSNSYTLPNQFDVNFIAPYLKSDQSQLSHNQITVLTQSLLDSTKQKMRLSMRMADVGSEELKVVKQYLQEQMSKTLDSNQFQYTITGAAITFLEGNVFIMQGLRESILWAIALIAACMIYLFRSFKIVLISILLNLLPLLGSLGVMGFCHVALQPSTVIIFSIVLGISVDITIRYLVTFRYLCQTRKDLTISDINTETLQETFTSILYTAITLVAGFLIFSWSSFGGIQALGWITSLSLFVASIFNLVFLPLLLNRFYHKA